MCVCARSPLHSIPQKERSPSERAAFEKALKVMGNLYGSLWLTTVIQIKSVYEGAGFNSRAYGDRGWCCFEEGAAKLAAHHRRKAAKSGAADRNPKLIELSDDGEMARVVDVASTRRPRLDELEGTINAAHFTGKGDKEVVVKMLKDYNALLAFGRGGGM